MTAGRPIPPQEGSGGATGLRSLGGMAASPDVVERVLTWSRVDFSPQHDQPRWWRLAVATVLSIGFSLAADAALVAVGTHLYPATKGYSHFQFSDYAKLTIIGVLIACAAWPVVTTDQLGTAVVVLPPRHRGDARPVVARRLDLAQGSAGARGRPCWS